MKLWEITSTQNSLSSNANAQTRTSTSTAASEYAKILADKIANAKIEMEQMNEIQEALDEIQDLHEELTGHRTDEKSSGGSSSEEATETVKKFLPDGSILVMTVKDGEVVEQNKKKPHMVAVPDLSAPLTPSGNTAVTIKAKPQLDFFSLVL